MKVKHKIWFEAQGLTIFGPGRNEFFRKIDECHSLNSAAKKLNVSYRLAWGKIKVSQERLGMRLVEVSSGENRMHLTENARELLSIFDNLEKEITPILQRAENRILTLKKGTDEEIVSDKEIVNQKNPRSSRPLLESWSAKEIQVPKYKKASRL